MNTEISLIYNITMSETEQGVVNENRTPSQKDFELLIGDFQKDPGRGIRRKIETPEGSPTIYIQESKKTIPYIGVEVAGREGKVFKYEVGFNKGNAGIYATPILTEISGGKETGPLSEVAGAGVALDESVAGVIIQAAANGYKEKITHSMNSPSDKKKLEKLIDEGYVPRDRLYVILDKTFKPSGAK